MDEKVYGYMDWPRIEAIVYGEETAPRDVMGPRITQDGVLIQGFFPDAEEVNVIRRKENLCLRERGRGRIFAVFASCTQGAGIQISYKDGERQRKNVMIPMLFHARSQRKRRRLSAQVFIMRHIRSWALIQWRLKE